MLRHKPRYRPPQGGVARDAADGVVGLDGLGGGLVVLLGVVFHFKRRTAAAKAEYDRGEKQQRT